MAAPPPPRGGPSASGTGGASPAPSLLSVSSGTSRISFAIPSAAPPKAAPKPAPINLDTRAGLPAKPVAAINAALNADKSSAGNSRINTRQGQLKSHSFGSPRHPPSSNAPWQSHQGPNGAAFGGMRMERMGSSSSAGPSTERVPHENPVSGHRSSSPEPGEWVPPAPEPRPRSRSRDRGDRRDGRYRRDRDRDRSRERDLDRRDRDYGRDRHDHHRDNGRDHRRESGRDHRHDRDRGRDRDREHDKGDRYHHNGRHRGSMSPEKGHGHRDRGSVSSPKRRTYDDERLNGHGGHGRGPFSRESDRERGRDRDRDHDHRHDRYSRTRDLESRSPVKSPELAERMGSPAKRPRSPVLRRRSVSPRPHNTSKRAASPPPPPPPAAPADPAPPPAPASAPPPPPDDAPPPPPEPSSDAPPPPPPPSSPPPPPGTPPPPPPPKVEICLPSRPLSPVKAGISLTTRPPPSGPRALQRAPPSGPRAATCTTAANGNAPAYGPNAIPRGPAGWGGSIPTGNAAAAAQPPPPSAPPPPPPQPEWKPPPSAFRRPGAGSWLMVPDPSAGKPDAALVKRVDGVYNGVEARVRDPRLKIAPDVRQRGNGYIKQRKDGLHPLRYEWDEHSPGPKPPPPPCAVLLTCLSPLTTVDQVSKFLRPYGRIKEIDAKMDTRSGMQLGIVWVKFDGPAPGKTGTAHDVAKNVVKMCNGQRVGMQAMERAKVVLDGRGLLAEKAVKEEMARLNAPKPKPAPPPPKSIPPSVNTPSEGKQTPKPPNLSRPPTGVPPRLPPPRGPKFDALGRNFSSLNRSLPVGRFGQHLPSRPGVGVQDFSREFRGPAYQDSRDARRFPRSGDTWSPHSRSRSPSPVSSSESDSDDDFRRRGAASPRRRARGLARAAMEKKEADEAAVERVHNALAANGKAYVFVDAKSLPPTHPEANVRDHFRAFRPDDVLSNHAGWFVLFADGQTAYRAQRVLDKTAVQGHRVNIEVRTPKGEEGKAAGPAEPEKAAGTGGWRFLTISKNRKAVPARPPSPKKAPRRRLSVSYTSSDEDEPIKARRGTKTGVVDKAKPEPIEAVEPRVEEVKVEPVVDEGETKVEIEVSLEQEPVETKKKRPAKETKAGKAKKARVEEPVAEIKVAPAPTPKVPKPKPRKKTVFDKLVAADQLADDEDAFWLAQALAHEDGELALSDAESDLDEEHPLFHTSGAWRAEGIRKVAPAKKSAYLRNRNRATAAASDAAPPGGGATGRTARVEGRRLAIDMESTRKAVSAQHAEANDVFAFNQLRIRKKQLRFQRSEIEGYGLYAMETIQPNEMVCEYVGELCRVAVSEVREQRYMKQGIGSSYLFRIDGDIVCDATFKGSVSRLVNHSCDPNCLAKIISINGVNKIVLYAKRTIHPGEECLYSYNFALETDPALRVPCLCGSEKCTGFLN